MKRFLFTISLFVLCFGITHAAKWRVNNTPGIDADFTSFKAAHDAASTGDTLMFEGAVLAYGEQDTLYKQLTIIGPGYFLGLNDTTMENVLPAKLGILVIDSLAKGSHIMGMSIVGGFDALIVDASNVVIERNRIISTIALCYNKPVHNVIISKNYCSDIDTRWGSNTLYATNIIIANNIITHTISFNANSSLVITNNTVGADIIAYNSTVKSNISGYISSRDGSSYENNIVTHDAPTGTGNIGNVNLNDIYISTSHDYDGTYKLAASSPAKGAGVGGTDCGAFGGQDSYILSGYPPMPVIYDVQIATGAVEGLPVSLKARSQK